MAQITTEKQEKFHIIHFPEIINHATCDQASLLTKTSWAEIEVETHVLDFSKVVEFIPKAYRIFVNFKQLLKSKDRDLISIGLSPVIQKQITADGMDDVFRPTANLETGMREIQSRKPKATLNTDFINPFIAATKLTLSVQAKTPTEVGKPKIKKNIPNPEVCIAAVLNLDAEIFQGAIVLSFPQPVFLGIYKNMFDEVHTEITKDIQDAAGELLNIIFGQAKKELNDNKSFQIKKALPTVFLGKNLEILKTSQTRVVIVLPCTTNVGEFTLEIHLGPNG